VINISNSTSKDNPLWPSGKAWGIPGDRQPPRGPGAGGMPENGQPPRGRRAKRILLASRGKGIKGILRASGDGQSPREREDPAWFPPMGYTLLSWVAYALRRHGDRWFSMSDNEAYWRGWQITKTHAGLGRCYRDPRFDTLAACGQCAGAGVYANTPCGPCEGTGRITLGEVS
jgi:hypothetical protein